jgi:hypothetical protein
VISCPRSKVSEILLPKLKEFQPDLLFISAGFDTHYDDFYHFLTEDDLHWITYEMCQIVDSNPNNIGVISVLEGGYSLESKIQTKSTSSTKPKVKGCGGEKPELDLSTMYGQLPGDGGLVKGYVFAFIGVFLILGFNFYFCVVYLLIQRL